MKHFSFLSIGLVLMCATSTVAFDEQPQPLSSQRGRYTLQPQIPDLVPNDGIMDGGSYVNPYILEGSDGSRYEVMPQLPDIFPHDGMLDAGSFSNPWVIEPVE